MTALQRNLWVVLTAALVLAALPARALDDAAKCKAAKNSPGLLRAVRGGS